jgi:hypothetical protein
MAGNDPRTHWTIRESEKKSRCPLISPEKEVNGSRDGRLKALRAQFERMKELEVLIRERVEAGVRNFNPAHQALAEFARCEADIWVRKAEAEKK